MSYNCMGAALVRAGRSRLLPHGAGQRHASGGEAAIAVAKKISRGEARSMAREEGVYTYAGGKRYVGTGPDRKRLKDYVHDTVQQSKKDVRDAKKSIAAFHRADGAGSGMPNILFAAHRMTRGYVPENTNSSAFMTPTGTLSGFGAAPSSHISRSEARTMARKAGVITRGGKKYVLGTGLRQRDFVRNAMKAGRGMTSLGAIPQPLAISMPRGGMLGPVPLDPLRPMRAHFSPRAEYWQRRAYGVPITPGLGFDFGSILSSVGGGGGGGGILSMVSSFLPSAADKAAKSAAKSQAAIAQAQVKAAKIAAASQTEGAAASQKMLVIGGGMALTGLMAWLIFRKKS